MNADNIVNGYIDAHVHLVSAAGLADAIAAGVSFLRDAGTREGTGLALTHSEEPRVLSAGWALYPEGGYGSRFGVAIKTREDARGEVKRLKDAGAGIIKVMASGMVSLAERGVITPGGFDEEMLGLIVSEASANSLKVMAHANGGEAIIAACEAGAISIEHGFFMTEEALDWMKQRNVLWVPTVGALHRAAGLSSAPAGAKEIAAETIKAHLKMIGKAHKLGVRLGIGTDCTLPDPKYCEAYEAELEWFRRVGIPEHEVMMMASEAGKEMFEAM